MLRRIENTNSNYDRSRPIEIDVVTKAAKYVFSDDNFEKDQNNPVAMRLRHLTNDEDSLSDEDYDKRKKKPVKKKKYISNEDSSDEEDERRKRRARKVLESNSESGDELRTRRKSRKTREESEEESEEEDRRRKKKVVKKRRDAPGDEEEARKEVQTKVVEVDVDGIVRRIQSLKVDNSEYAVCYFKLLEVKPTVTQLLPSPFQHMRSALVQQAATYPNNIPISSQRPRSNNCHFCGVPGCRIGTCKVVNEYVRGGRVIQEGRMVLYVDKDPIAWNPQGLKISVDFRFGGPLTAPGTLDNTPDTTQIQTMFVTCAPAEDLIISAAIQEEKEDAPVTTFATTRSKTKEAKVVPETNSKSPPIINSTALPPRKNPAYTYESKAIIPDAIKTVKQKILEQSSLESR